MFFTYFPKPTYYFENDINKNNEIRRINSRIILWFKDYAQSDIILESGLLSNGIYIERISILIHFNIHKNYIKVIY